MFEKAARTKLRFNYKGLCSAEDLWDLNVVALDSIYKGLKANLREAQEESLLEKKTPADDALALQIAIVKHIVTTKLTELETREAAVAKAEKKQKILGIIAKKQDESLEGLGIAELTAMVEGL